MTEEKNTIQETSTPQENTEAPIPSEPVAETPVEPSVTEAAETPETPAEPVETPAEPEAKEPVEEPTESPAEDTPKLEESTEVQSE